MNLGKLLHSLQTRDLKYKVNSSGDWVSVDCPFCGDRGLNGNISVANNYFHCWKGCGGKSINVYFKAVGIIVDFSLNERPRDIGTGSLDSTSHVKLPHDNFSKPHIKYLNSRGFNVDLLRNYYRCVGTLETNNILSFRLVIPIYYNQNLLGFTARSIRDSKYVNENLIPRYVNEGLIKRTLWQPVYREDYAVLCEGVFDAIRFGAGATCSFGMKLTKEQRSLLLQYKRVIIAFDNELLANELSNELRSYLHSYNSNVVVEIMDLSKYHVKDLAEMSDDQISKIRVEYSLY